MAHRTFCKVLYEEKSNNSTLTSHGTLSVFRSHQLYNNSFHPEDDDVKLPNPDSDRSSRSYTKFNCYLNYTSIKRLTEIKIFFVSPSSSSTEQASKHTYIHTHIQTDPFVLHFLVLFESPCQSNSDS